MGEMKIKVILNSDYPGLEIGDILTFNMESRLYELKKSYTVYSDNVNDEDEVVRVEEHYNSYICLSAVEVETNLKSTYNNKGVFEYVSTDEY